MWREKRPTSVGMTGEMRTAVKMSLGMRTRGEPGMRTRHKRSPGMGTRGAGVRTRGEMTEAAPVKSTPAVKSTPVSQANPRCHEDGQSECKEPQCTHCQFAFYVPTI